MFIPKLYGPDVNPHVFGVMHYKDIPIILDMWDELMSYRFGVFHLYRNLYVEKHLDYRWSDPNLIVQLLDRIRSSKCESCCYLHAWDWKKAQEKNGYEAAQLPKKLGCTGIFLDGGTLGYTIQDTWDSFRLIKNMNPGPVIHHCSMEPHYGRNYTHRGYWTEFEDYTLWGETNIAPEDLHDPIWKNMVGQEYRSNAIGMYKPNGKWKEDDRWAYLMPFMNCTVRVNLHNWFEIFKKIYFPLWEKENARLNKA